MHFFEKEKFPRRIIVVIDSANLRHLNFHLGYYIDVLASSLANIPHILSLTITCENGPDNMWDTEVGFDLAKYLQAYIGGMVRGVGAFNTIGLPDTVSTTLTRQITSRHPASPLLFMYKALQDFACTHWMHTTCRSWEVEMEKRAPYYEARRAMERGDWDQFMHHREAWVKDIIKRGEMKRVPKGIYSKDQPKEESR